jgi:hypothetical protein
MDFNDLKELDFDFNVSINTSITQISTFQEQTSTLTMVEHLQVPNASMCTSAALATPCAFPNASKCSK